MDELAAPPVEEFERECRDFLEARYPRRRQERKRFAWGEGSDRVAVFEEADREAEKVVIANVRAWRRALWDNGLGWITGPAELGGRGLRKGYQQVFDTIVRDYEVPGNAPLTVSLGMIAPTIQAHAVPEVRNRYVPALHNGDLIACQLFSEPGAGSDLAGVGASATRDGDGWRLTGQKVWTSGAHYSDIGEILCRTSPGPRHKNLTMFVVDLRTKGVEIRPLRQMTGGAAFNEIFLDDVWVPDDHRLGDVGEGWRVAMTTLLNERNAIGGDGFGGSGLLDIERYKAMVRHFGLASDPVTRQRLATLYMNLRIAKMTRQRAGAKLAAGQVPGPEASLGKLVLAQNYLRISDLVGSILGP
ncbi:MAG: acyl-CoA dehydrogenase, partial [Actinobacteria bacterium]|nr:acyl-CoA dehydrogenase [Actinomycetota bacterium]